MTIIRRKRYILCILTILLSTSFLQRNIGYSEYNCRNFKGNSEPTLSYIKVGSYTVPGISESIPSDQIVKIGLLNDMKHVFGEHAWKGALIAAREINEGGGILINGTKYYIGLVYENTKELQYPRLIPPAVNATEYMIQNHDPHFITGGIGGDNFDAYLEIIMDHEIPFICTGSAVDQLCKNVLLNYTRYKYFFRIMPMSWESNFADFKDHIISLAKYLNTTYGGMGKNKIAILHEDSLFGNMGSDIFESWLPTFNLTVVEKIQYFENVTEEDFEQYWNQIETAKAQITMVLNMRYPRMELIAKQYQAVKPHCLLFNPNNMKYCTPYWDDTEGACQFEILYQPIYNTSKTNATMPFFNNFVNENGVEPFHTATGSYDTVYLLAHAVADSQSFNADTIVTNLEKINDTNPLTGAGNNLAFTSAHDVLRGYPYGYGLLCQHKYIDGTKIVAPSDEVYPNFIATDSLRLPYWGVNGLLTDPPDPPKDFTISSTAGTPDYDGKFNLTWTTSEGADNYSIYMSHNPLTYISKKFDLFAYQTATTPFPVSLKQGDYYFRVVAYNGTGETMSFNEVHVTIPGPGSFILSDDAKDPDKDGKFNLTWTNSDRADNYSVLQYRHNIVEVNESLTFLANQTAQSPFSVKGLKSRKYYFAVAAYNELGYTLSNNIDVIVQLPFDIWPVVTISFGSVAGVASIVLIRNYLKREKKVEIEHKGKHKK